MIKVYNFSFKELEIDRQKIVAVWIETCVG